MLAFYTVLLEAEGYPVKYIDTTTLRVKTFHGSFSDPGEASQEFKACIGKENSCYLNEQQFRQKARAIQRLRKN